MGHQSSVATEVELLHEQYALPLIRYATVLAESGDLARDAVQEAFLGYFVERSYGRQIAQPRPWLYQATRRHVMDRLRVRTGERVREIEDPAGGPEAIVDGSEAADEISGLFSPRERECLELRSDGFSYLEIAGLMGLRTGTVGALLTRVHQKIRGVTGGARAENARIARGLHHLFRQA